MQFANDTQMTSEGDAISFEPSVSRVDKFGRKSDLAMNSGKTQAIWLGSMTKQLRHIKMDRNPPKFKILGRWLIADLTDCEKIYYKVYFSEAKMLFSIWTKRTISPLGKRHFENSDSV